MIKRNSSNDTVFVEIFTEFVLFNKNTYPFDIISARRMILMKNKKSLSDRVNTGIKKGLSVVLKTNANSSGCYFIYQPKAPVALDKYKKIK